ncbi:MAG: hypothetical protein QG604_830 [Candidatus Dependentiae bacterium]|nr:hypothetical protein [Candidatus Dependentiae bacterium]
MQHLYTIAFGFLLALFGGTYPITAAITQTAIQTQISTIQASAFNARNYTNITGILNNCLLQSIVLDDATKTMLKKYIDANNLTIATIKAASDFNKESYNSAAQGLNEILTKFTWNATLPLPQAQLLT